MTLMEVHQQVLEHVPEAVLGRFTLSFDPAGQNIIPADEHIQLASQPLKHGDILYLKVVQQFYAEPQAVRASSRPQEDLVDVLLRKVDGRILRGKDSHYCHHGPSGMCSHCMPLEPYDAGHQSAKGIKHLSFHAHLRKLAGSSGQNHVGPLLEEASFRVKSGCAGHPPYPEGICTKCQPSAIILNPQAFRMVDHVELDNPKLVEDFLGGWRSTGYQRFGWLLGRNEMYDGVPLGIKAVVSAIYEPPQDGSVDGFLLMDDPNYEAVEAVASSLSLSVVGMIYTDLTDDGSRSGKVLHKRSAENFFVSSAEIIFMAQNQAARPSPCTDSATGKFSSKFVTVIVTGNENKDIDFLAFQVSNTAEKMVEAEIIEATTDPNMMMAKASVPKKHYVPEVIYKLNDEYGNTVQRKAEPFFPVEYLLLTLSHGFPVKLDPMFKSTLSFPALSSNPTMSSLKTYMDQARNLPLNMALSSFNLLSFLQVQRLLDTEEMKDLCKALINRDEAELHSITLNSGNWATIMTLVAEVPSPPSGKGRDWTCPHCTFINVDRTVDACEICGLPAS